jgi:hypothetical protein
MAKEKPKEQARKHGDTRPSDKSRQIPVSKELDEVVG